MNRTRRAEQVWNRLPAFHAVASSEHLPTASKEASLSASALSRAVKLLEQDLGIALFAREGRSLQLTAAGMRLLAAMRHAVGAVEASLGQVLASETTGAVHIAAPGPYVGLFVIPALRLLREAHPHLIPHVQSASPVEMVALLIDGALDICLTDESLERSELQVRTLGELSHSVYAGRTHPLAALRDPSVEDVLAHAFVAPSEGTSDHFPPDLQRRIGMVVEQIHVAMDVCAYDGMLAVLPDLLAKDLCRDGVLVRIPFEQMTPHPLYALSRRASAEPRPINFMLDAISIVLGENGVGPASSTRSSMWPPAQASRSGAATAGRFATA